jgi:hypothetical protein
MRKITLLLFVTSFVFAKNIDPKKTYTGNINSKFSVVFELKNTNGILSGFYFYEKKGIDIPLIGTIKNQEVELFELDYLKHKTAKITGILKNNVFTGKWENLASKKSFPIIFKQNNLEITPLPKNIIGIYKIKNEEETDKCDLTISISFLKGDYFYNIKAKNYNKKGKVSFSRSLLEKTNYIIFEGLTPAEGSGTYVDGLFTNNEITIQNYGNAMNYYVKLAVCSGKYLNLVKK